MSSPKDWNRFLDEITFADIEHEDLVRITKTADDGIDEFDSEKVMSDLCSLRYRFGFIYLGMQACSYISRPKECLHQSIRDIGKAIKVLRFLKAALIETQEELDEDEEENGRESSREENASEADEADETGGETGEEGSSEEEGEGEGD